MNCNTCYHNYRVKQPCGMCNQFDHWTPLIPESQPAPTPNDSEPIWHLVVADMLKRDNEGRKKYNTPLQAHNGRDALQDAYEEALDLAVYLKTALEERKQK